MKPSEIFKPIIMGAAAGVAIVVSWALFSPVIDGTTFDGATFDGATFTGDASTGDCTPTECVRILTGGDMSFPTRTSLEAESLIAEYESNHPTSIRAINVSDRVLNALLTESILRDGSGVNRGVRIYYGQRPVSGEIVGILYPLNSDFEITAPMDGEYISLDLEHRVSGPCPMHCYGE